MVKQEPPFIYQVMKTQSHKEVNSSSSQQDNRKRKNPPCLEEDPSSSASDAIILPTRKSKRSPKKPRADKYTKTQKQSSSNTKKEKEKNPEQQQGILLGMRALAFRLGKHVKPKKRIEQQVTPSVDKKESTRINLNAGQWKMRLNELKEYHAQHGHCCVPQSYLKNQELYRWVKRQRYQYKLLISNSSSTLTKDRMDALNMLGFCWEGHKSIWMQRYQELKTFKEEHGHTLVPFGSSPNNEKDESLNRLASWVKSQRRQMKFKREGNSNSMNDERIALLDEIDFSWTPRGERKKLLALAKASGKRPSTRIAKKTVLKASRKAPALPTRKGPNVDNDSASPKTQSRQPDTNSSSTIVSPTSLDGHAHDDDDASSVASTFSYQSTGNEHEGKMIDQISVERDEESVASEFCEQALSDTEKENGETGDGRMKSAASKMHVAPASLVGFESILEAGRILEQSQAADYKPSSNLIREEYTLSKISAPRKTSVQQTPSVQQALINEILAASIITSSPAPVPYAAKTKE